MRLSFSSRFWLFAPVAFFVIVASVAMAHWWTLTSALDKRLDQINGHEAVPGITLSFAGKAISGFPFNIDIVLTGVEIKGQGAHGPFRWTSEKFAAHRLTYGRRQDIYEAAGNQTLSWTDGRTQSHGVSFLPGALHASMLADAKGLARFDLDVVNARGTDLSGAPFTAAHLQFHMRRDPKGDGLNLMISGANVTASSDIAGLFGTSIKNLKVYANLTKGQAFAGLLAGTSDWPAAADAWRRSGGQVTIGPVEIASSSLNLSAPAFADTGDDLRGLLSPLY